MARGQWSSNLFRKVEGYMKKNKPGSEIGGSEDLPEQKTTLWPSIGASSSASMVGVLSQESDNTDWRTFHFSSMTHAVLNPMQ